MTMQITIIQYLMGREHTYHQYFNPVIEKNAITTVNKVNELLKAIGDDVSFELNPTTMNLVSSGWRPPPVNKATYGAAPNSLHVSAEACDLYDPNGDIDEWCINNVDVLRKLGLSMEHPSMTKGWCHIQTRPPRSGRTIFYP